MKSKLRPTAGKRQAELKVSNTFLWHLELNWLGKFRHEWWWETNPKMRLRKLSEKLGNSLEISGIRRDIKHSAGEDLQSNPKFFGPEPSTNSSSRDSQITESAGALAARFYFWTQNPP